MVVVVADDPLRGKVNVWQMVANKWNDPLFLPVTSLKPDTKSELINKTFFIGHGTSSSYVTAVRSLYKFRRR